MAKSIDELEVYQIAAELSDDIWNICSEWNWFDRKTIGIQLVKAADSISANIAEGYGRYFYKENIQFCYYSRGSLYETQHWIRRAFKRNIITSEQELNLNKIINTLAPKLNAYINAIKKESNKDK
ncbi:MAG: four helix bundle protein [Bacteroidota bacterium]|nr:four helix bundle protein [Bacteroidota bacterium]